MRALNRMNTDGRSSLAYVITSMDYGGAERQVVALAAGFRRRGWNVDVITLIKPRALADELSEAGVRLRSLGMRRSVPDPRAIPRLAALLNRRSPAVVHSHMVHANLLARVTRLLAPIPFLVSTAHSVMEGGRALDVGYRMTDPLCDVTTNVSPAGVKRYLDRGLSQEGRIRFIPNGIDLASFQRRDGLRPQLHDALGVEDGFVWLAVGRFDSVKDYASMLSAFSIVASGAATTLVMAGDGELRPAMEAMAAKLGVADRVRFLGVRSDIVDLMSAADGYVLSSAWEGLPMVLLEAAAASLPIVATDVGGVREIVVHGATGFVVRPGDPAALAVAMRTLMDAPADERRTMGAAGREHVQAHFDIERVLDTWEDLYLAGIASAGGRTHRWARRRKESGSKQ